MFGYHLVYLIALTFIFLRIVTSFIRNHGRSLECIY